MYEFICRQTNLLQNALVMITVKVRLDFFIIHGEYITPYHWSMTADLSEHVENFSMEEVLLARNVFMIVSTLKIRRS